LTLSVKSSQTKSYKLSLWTSWKASYC